MLDNYIQGFEEARQFIQHHYDALPMQNNANRFKHGNRCPQGEYWVQPQGEKGFCRRTNGQKKKMGTGVKAAIALGTTAALVGGGVAIHKGLKSLPNAVVKPKTEKQKWEEKRSQIINQGSKDLDNLLN